MREPTYIGVEAGGEGFKIVTKRSLILAKHRYLAKLCDLATILISKPYQKPHLSYEKQGLGFSVWCSPWQTLRRASQDIFSEIFDSVTVPISLKNPIFKSGLVRSKSSLDFFFIFENLCGTPFTLNKKTLVGKSILISTDIGDSSGGNLESASSIGVQKYF
jgi:hypothetical protein